MRRKQATPPPALTYQVLVVTQLVPLASHLHELVAKAVLLLFVLVRVKLPERFRIWIWVGIGRIGNEWVGRVNGGLGSPVHWGNHRGSLVAVDAQAALAGHLDQLRGGTGR